MHGSRYFSVERQDTITILNRSTLSRGMDGLRVAVVRSVWKSPRYMKS